VDDDYYLSFELSEFDEEVTPVRDMGYALLVEAFAEIEAEEKP
jgi:hypothetical protein